MNYAQSYAVFCFVVSILITSLLIPQSRTKNIALLTAIFWYAQGVLFSGVRAWIWSDNVIVRLEVFCDISQYLPMVANGFLRVLRVTLTARPSSRPSKLHQHES